MTNPEQKIVEEIMHTPFTDVERKTARADFKALLEAKFKSYKTSLLTSLLKKGPKVCQHTQVELVQPPRCADCGILEQYFQDDIPKQRANQEWRNLINLIMTE